MMANRATTPAPFGALLLGTRLSDSEVFASLAEELERERAECHERMAAVIREASEKVVCLPSTIFTRSHLIFEHRKSCLAAIKRQERAGGDAAYLNTMRAFLRHLDTVASLHHRLREIRSAVAHADPADYWQKKASAWDSGLGFSRAIGEP